MQGARGSSYAIDQFRKEQLRVSRIGEGWLLRLRGVLVIGRKKVLGIIYAQNQEISCGY
jgi:hypothetical protein